MRNLFRFAFITLLFCVPTLVKAQPGLKRLTPKSPIVCYQSFIDNPINIPPTDRFQQMRKNPLGRLKTATFEVEYSGFPDDNLAKNAFQHAIEIWESELVSPVTIRIRAEWSPTLASGVLGQAIWGAAYANFDGAQHLNTFYPVALAEKIVGHEINASNEFDIVATFNSSVNWYYQPTGTPATGQMDLITIVLHEIAHGLGFTDTYDFEDNQGSVGLESGGVDVPFVYDLFVENGTGDRLFNDFTSPSAAMGTQIKSNNLYFYSPRAMASIVNRPKIYGPSTFNAGSSIAHLDEATFTDPDANRLMTPQIDFREKIHDPGDVTRGILSDLGWVFTKIEHTRLTDTERQDGQPYPVVVKIRSDIGYSASSVKLHYTTDGTTYTVLTMTPTGVANEFQSALPGTTSEIIYGYFISVTDDLNREYTNPGKLQVQGQDPEQAYIDVKIGPDMEAPTIVHSPVDYVFEDQTQLEINAIVTDNLGVAGVVLEYRIAGGALQTLAMGEGSTDNYSATISLPSALQIGDRIEYRIVATDNSSGQNQGTEPETGFIDVVVTGIMPVQDSYSNDFDTETNDFVGNSFSIATPSGFESPAIHSKHPYDNGSGPNDESNYIYQLQIPIRIDESNPYIRFDEIVLVEPGETGSVFGDNDFWDYVIIEGSTDLGTTWTPFEDGYDARAEAVWVQRYESSVENSNSLATGDPSLFRQRTINMVESGAFSNGDEVLIRFRLFADQAAHGWGWAIDNLYIQDAVTGIEEDANAFSVYPNPAMESITIEFKQEQPNAEIQIINLQGAEIVNAKPTSKVTNIDIAVLQEGIYILKTRIGNRVVAKKIAKKDY